jgi:hypothetical protein
VQLQIVEARGPEDFDRAFADMTGARADALTAFIALVRKWRKRLVDLAARNRLPTVYSFRSMSIRG